MNLENRALRPTTLLERDSNTEKWLNVADGIAIFQIYVTCNKIYTENQRYTENH